MMLTMTQEGWSLLWSGMNKVPASSVGFLYSSELREYVLKKLVGEVDWRWRDLDPGFIGCGFGGFGVWEGGDLDMEDLSSRE
jgi:hypothetical protein